MTMFSFRNQLPLASPHLAPWARARIVSAARVVFTERGYAATSEAEIALRADVPWSVFDQCFAHKDEVLYEIASQANERLVRRVISTLGLNPRILASPDGMASAAEARVRALVEAFAAGRDDEAPIRAIMSARRRYDDALDSLCCTMERTLVNLITRLLDLLGRSGDRVAIALVLYGLVDGAMRAQERRERLLPDARMIDAVVEAVLDIVFPGRAAH